MEVDERAGAGLEEVQSQLLGHHDFGPRLFLQEGALAEGVCALLGERVVVELGALVPQNVFQLEGGVAPQVPLAHHPKALQTVLYIVKGVFQKKVDQLLDRGLLLQQLEVAAERKKLVMLFEVQVPVVTLGAVALLPAIGADPILKIVFLPKFSL